MKTILLWDPRLPGLPPQRLTVDDAIAAAAVRSGVAAAVNPADTSALMAGGPVSPGKSVSGLLQIGLGETVRSVLPSAVLKVAQNLRLGAPAPDALQIVALPDDGASSASTLTFSTRMLTFQDQPLTYGAVK